MTTRIELGGGKPAIRKTLEEAWRALEAELKARRAARNRHADLTGLAWGGTAWSKPGSAPHG